MSLTVITICILAVMVVFLIIWNIILTVNISKWASVDYVDKKFLRMGELAYKDDVGTKSVTYEYQRYKCDVSCKGSGSSGTSSGTWGTSRGIGGGTPGTPGTWSLERISLHKLLNMLLDHLDLKIDLIPSQEEKHTLVYCPGNKEGDPSEN